MPPNFDRRRIAAWIAAHSKIDKERGAGSDRNTYDLAVDRWITRGRTCCYCLRTLTLGIREHDRSPSFDHVIPVSQGGSTTPENLDVCCRRCNLIKGTMRPDEFLAFLVGRSEDELQTAYYVSRLELGLELDPPSRRTYEAEIRRFEEALSNLFDTLEREAKGWKEPAWWWA